MTFSYRVNGTDNGSPLEPSFWSRESVSTKRSRIFTQNSHESAVACTISEDFVSKPNLPILCVNLSVYFNSFVLFMGISKQSGLISSIYSLDLKV